jgi:hypothetical protein
LEIQRRKNPEESNLEKDRVGEWIPLILTNWKLPVQKGTNTTGKVRWGTV